MTTSVIIGGAEGITFSGGARTSGFYFNNIINWYGFEESTGEFESVPNRNLSFASDEFFVTRATPSIEGVYVGRSVQDALQARARLSALRNRGRLTTLEVRDDFMPTFRDVKVKRVQLPHSRHSSFKFAIDMLSPDAFRYAEEFSRTIGLPTPGIGGLEYPITYPIEYGIPGDQGFIEIVNNGTEDGIVDIHIEGGSTGGFTVITAETGDQVTYSRYTPEGSILDLNGQFSNAVLNDQTDVSIYLTDSEWPVIPAGGRRTLQFSAIGTAFGEPKCTLRFRPPYL